MSVDRGLYTCWETKDLYIMTKPFSALKEKKWTLSQCHHRLRVIYGTLLKTAFCTGWKGVCAFLESFLKFKNDSETTATPSLFSILQVGGPSPRSKDWPQSYREIGEKAHDTVDHTGYESETGRCFRLEVFLKIKLSSFTLFPVFRLMVIPQIKLRCSLETLSSTFCILAFLIKTHPFLFP